MLAPIELSTTRFFRPLFRQQFQEQTPSLLVGPLMLANKYEAFQLQDFIISFLSSEWPGDEYGKWCTRDRVLEKGTRPDPMHLIQLSWRVRLRDELRLPLAMAYYELSCQSSDKYDVNALRAEDYCILLDGRSKVANWLLEAVQSSIYPYTCNSCQTFRVKMKLAADAVVAHTSGRGLDILRFLEKTAMDPEFGCGFCIHKSSQWVRKLAAGLYSQIPIIFMGHPSETE